jgi:hypothetical protein
VLRANLISVKEIEIQNLSQGGGMSDLRTFLTDCEKKLNKEFMRISQEVDPRYEVTAIIKNRIFWGDIHLFCLSV